MNHTWHHRAVCHVVCLVFAANAVCNAADSVELYGVYETAFESTGHYSNPFTDLEADAVLRCPERPDRTIPLFWDGGETWRLRVSPDTIGDWSFTVRSEDAGLSGKRGSFQCVESDRRGSIRPMTGSPLHFEYQNGDPMWFMGDTAWALLTDSREERHDRSAAQKYLQARAAQGFNVVHSMVLSEAGWGNSGGKPFHDMTAQRINPAYWQEMDHRVEYANSQGLVVGLAVAWGDKRKQEPFAWRRFPNLEARSRYARYVAARYSAFDVYFLVSGEWHAEVRTRGSSEGKVKQEFIKIGNALAEADPHDRMIGIHPMTRHGSVREFNDTEWMSFGDYQQNYRELHARILESLPMNKPVVNSEYGYLLRDQNGDGTPDKDNSTSLESIRHASWDIAMAGGYLVTGFGTTYFGGNRDPGPFNVDAKQNDQWEEQIGQIKRFFSSLDWWILEPHDDWLTCATPRGKDGKQFGRLAPPATTYWLLAEPGKNYVAYVRGVSDKLTLQLGPSGAGDYRVRVFNPRTGEVRRSGQLHLQTEFKGTPPDTDDWVLHLTRVDRR